MNTYEHMSTQPCVYAQRLAPPGAQVLLDDGRSFTATLTYRRKPGTKPILPPVGAELPPPEELEDAEALREALGAGDPSQVVRGAEAAALREASRQRSFMPNEQELEAADDELGFLSDVRLRRAAVAAARPIRQRFSMAELQLMRSQRPAARVVGESSAVLDDAASPHPSSEEEDDEVEAAENGSEGGAAGGGLAAPTWPAWLSFGRPRDDDDGEWLLERKTR